MQGFWAELRRRNVVKVSVAYVIVSWIILQVVDLVIPILELPDWFAKMVLVLVAIGFPVAALFAWAFELTPDGLKRSHEVEAEQSITSETGRKLEHLVLGLVVVALLYFVWESRFADPALERPARAEATEGQTSIAVLPFVNMSSDPEQEYFSDGISEELLNVLAQLPELRVAARTSSFQFKGKSLDIAEVAKQLNVDHVLEGSVRKSGTRIRITAQLIEAETGYHLWSDSYDRELVDVFAIQDEIANAIVTALIEKLGITTATTRPVEEAASFEAYEEFLLGRHLTQKRTTKDIRRAITHLEKAVALDPDYAPARAGLAIAYLLFNDQNYGDIPVNRSIRMATVHIDHAVGLAPDLADVYAARGLARWNDSRATEALADIETALRLRPSESVYHVWRAELLSGLLGRPVEGLKAGEKAARLDPLFPLPINNLGYYYSAFGRFDEAWQQVEKLKQLSSPFARLLEMRLYSDMNRPLEALKTSVLALDEYPDDETFIQDFTYIATAFFADETLTFLGDPTFAYALSVGDPAVLIRFIEATPNPAQRLQNLLGEPYALSGDIDRALPLLMRTWVDNREGVSRDYFFLLNFAETLRQTGDDATAAVVSRSFWDHITREKELGLRTPRGLEAIVLMSDGRLDDGIALMRDYVRDGGTFLPDWPLFRRFMDDPRMADVKAGAAANTDRVRAGFLDWYCVETPPVTAFKIAPEKCAAHTGGGG